jgi:hypothetical protein
MKIVFIGNFSVPFSTESHHKWTWEKMGHQVVALQERNTTTDEVLRHCQGADVLQWTHTHGWGFSGSVTPFEMLVQAERMGVVSFSYHLDIYFGLNLLDRRAERVGSHPSWKVAHFFSTDGSHQAQYEAKGVNHHYLPPGVVEYGCYKGQFKPEFASEVGFVGSIGYHPEYPFRAELVAKLKERYGTRFRTYAGMREQALNNVYASVQVVVGDHCFSGMPYYWSDRLPETCGRGGFLLYPETKGMTIPTATYAPKSLPDLFDKIDYYLAHPEERNVVRDRAFEHVKLHDTYTNRLQEVLRVIGKA